MALLFRGEKLAGATEVLLTYPNPKKLYSPPVLTARQPMQGRGRTYWRIA